MAAVKKQRSNQHIKRHKKESPCPGTYNIRDFLQDANLNPVQQTYSFKGQGRKKPLSTAGSGEALLPGCYKIAEFSDLVEHLPRPSSFRSTSRSAVQNGVKDKDINTDPGQYNLITPPVYHHQCKHFMFRSTVQRFPTIYFIPREGPGPGDYNLKNNSSPSISSSFKSSVPRFRSPSGRREFRAQNEYEIDLAGQEKRSCLIFGCFDKMPMPSPDNKSCCQERKK
ncbi:protein STPG4 isoform X3 [Eleutherodactylus coqui]|uniref:protein STPG4 isoform X3 n=1 Tax=Eleutherodactylus coqui TaxID=57060 RepID=UPI003461AAFB